MDKLVLEKFVAVIQMSLGRSSEKDEGMCLQITGYHQPYPMSGS